MKQLLPIGLFLLIVNYTFGQSDSLLNHSIDQNKYPFKFEETFEGLGWEKIVEASKKHKYFLIGEDHGFAEIPIFCQALAKNVKFDLFVTEIDSIAASVAEKVAHSTEGEKSVFHKNHLSSLSFFSAKEEFDLLVDLVAQGADVWGLDQVSLFSSGIAFDELYKHS